MKPANNFKQIFYIHYLIIKGNECNGEVNQSMGLVVVRPKR